VFRKIVEYVGGSSTHLYEPLTSGQSVFDAKVPTLITSEQDYWRLVLSNDFKDVSDQYPELVGYPVTRPEAEGSPEAVTNKTSTWQTPSSPLAPQVSDDELNTKDND